MSRRIRYCLDLMIELGGLTHLVHIPQVFESSLLVHDGKVDNQVSIWLLGLFDHIHKFLDGRFELFGMG